jgi:hypothetical protein
MTTKGTIIVAGEISCSEKVSILYSEYRKAVEKYVDRED